LYEANKTSSFLTRPDAFRGTRQAFQNYELKIKGNSRQKRRKIRAKTFSIWRINFSEMAPKSFLFGVRFFEEWGTSEIITLLHILSQCTRHQPKYGIFAQKDSTI
ncbi:hypothetical protein, partial [Porphyromonas loveana]|uniref:hypothetical protein n=1 Tax=Porphyromonas loveana TaxID=1884669 RepID=UPI0035A07F23